jgi:hypothetical protein
VGYTLNRESRVGIGVSKVSRNSNAASFAVYDGIRFGTTVTYGF